jgi:2-polyprenyl-3-methyl-5-hydroxy-6-metoxy-1,4-benzoquinol methylase
LFWESVWNNESIESFVNYIKLQEQYEFINIFKRNQIVSICDVGCGFGKYSVICAYNGIEVSGFDISQSAINMTQEMLSRFKLPFGQYKTSNITSIDFDTESFDGVIAHAIIDHMPLNDALKAVEELLRITKPCGLVYFSFDGLNEDDIKMHHTVLEDGSFLYDGDNREGMLFRFYSDDEISKLFQDIEIIYQNTKQNGEREIILRKI